jgi:hypothetical protein
MIYKPRVLWGLYRRKLNIETKSQEETGTEMSSGVLSPPDSFSCPFSSLDYSYLIKTTKILMEKFYVNLF